MRKNINWLNHIIEFIVVVIGILIAFQLNKCSSERTQRKTIQTHLEQIQEETEDNLKSIEFSISLAETNLRKFDTLFQLIKTEDNLEEINRICLDLLNLGGLYLQKNAYYLLVESGDIRNMKNFAEKESLITLYEYYKWVNSFEEMLADDFSKDYYPYIKTNFDLIDGKIQEKEVYTCKEFKNILGAYYQLLNNKLSKYKDCQEKMNTYLEGLPSTP